MYSRKPNVRIFMYPDKNLCYNTIFVYIAFSGVDYEGESYHGQDRSGAGGFAEEHGDYSCNDGIGNHCLKGFFHYSKNTTSVAIIYVLVVMLVARYTTGYVPGILASVVGVICVNYVFTYPYMHLNFTIDGYPITFMGMIVVSLITSTLTTQFKRQSQILNEREKLLMEAEKETMRANLLRAVSHDLRTPLTSIIGMADTYLEQGDRLTEEEKSDMVKGINEDANWLLNMVENLLSVTRIRVGDTKVATNPEPLEEVVSEAVLRLRKRPPQANVRVKVPEEFLMVPMDAVLIEQVIMNLLENSVYHSGVETAIDCFVEKAEIMWNSISAITAKGLIRNVFPRFLTVPAGYKQKR